MAVLKTRNKLVNFRMTQDELDSLKMACLVKGARNVSDFARAAVLESIEAQTERGMLVETRLASLDTKLTEIGATLHYLADLLRNALARPGLAPSREPSPAAGQGESNGREAAQSSVRATAKALPSPAGVRSAAESTISRNQIGRVSE